MKLQVYTLRYLIVALLAIIAAWAGLFYAVMLEEVYDNIDDGLKNSRILILREVYDNETLLNTPEFGINQFRITPLPPGHYDYSDKFTGTLEYMEYDEDYEPVRLLQTVFNDRNGNPHQLTVRASMVEEDELLEDLLYALIALYVMLTISIALLNHLVLRRVWQSFYGMLRSLGDYRLGTGSRFEAPPSPVSEFRTLGRELESLLERSEELYASQKQFIENAAHELQTPLAISLNRLELFAGSYPFTEAQMAKIGKVTDTLNRLVRLNKSLLMLSRVENRQLGDEEEIDFALLVQDLAEDLAELAEYKSITLAVVPGSGPRFTMNRQLAATLVGNLVRNAMVHNHEGGSVTITLSGNSLTVSNTGNGKTLDSSRIFRRFYRDTPHGESTGLGLAITEAIATVYGLEVRYSFDGLHHFSVIFPQKN